MLALGGLFYGCSADSNGGGGTAGAGASGAAGGAAGAGGGSGGAAGGGNAGGSSGSGGAAGGGNAGGSGGSGNGAGTGGGGGIQDSGIPDVTFTYDGPVGSDGGVGDACAAATAKAEPLDLDMYIMLDRSGSMGADCNIGSGTASKWCFSVNALNGFFNAPTSVGMGVALQYFPISGYACTGSGGTCAFPAVPLSILPNNIAAFQASLNATTPSGSNTPTEAGMRGLFDYTQKNKQPGRAMIGILITDGDPNGCNGDPNYLKGLAQTHLTSTGIRTFVIGMQGATYSTLETIAQGGGAQPHTNYCAGGISPCHFYDVGSGSPAGFIAALQAIQQSAIACQFNVPKPEAGVLDPAKVSVEYTPGSGGPGQPLTKVSSSSQCGPSGGWYYDNNVNPTSISLCPSTCAAVQTDSNAKIDVLLGCLGS